MSYHNSRPQRRLQNFINDSKKAQDIFNIVKDCCYSPTQRNLIQLKPGWNFQVNLILPWQNRAYHQNKKFLKNLGGVFFGVLRVIEINVRKQVWAENAFFLSKNWPQTYKGISEIIQRKLWPNIVLAIIFSCMSSSKTCMVTNKQTYRLTLSSVQTIQKIRTV